MAQLYGHRPPPVMTHNERVLLEVIDEQLRPAGHFARQLPTLTKASMSVALVRLRNRGLVESATEGYSVRMWRLTTSPEKKA